MPRRRTALGAPRHHPEPPEAPFAPIAFVRVDVDAPLAAWPHDLGDGLVWVEAVHRGQVVGLCEARLEDGGLPARVHDDLVAAAAAADAAGAAEPPDDDRLPPASVVVPTLLHRPDQLGRTLASLEALDYPRFEVVVVDNRPSPSSPAPTFEGSPRVRVVAERVPGISAARNRGVASSSGTFIAFTDDDAVVEPGWLRALGARFALEPELGAVGGLVLPSELDTEAQLWFEEYYGGFSQSFVRSTSSLATVLGDPLFPYAPGRFGAGCNMAFRREALEALGGFDEDLGTGTPSRGGEDLASFIRLLEAGGTIGFEPGAVVRHSHRRTEREFLHQVRTYGTGLAAMYTSLVVHRPATLVELGRRVPAGVRLLVRSPQGRSPSAAPSYPRRALLLQVTGMALGPLAYAHSRLRRRREVAR